MDLNRTARFVDIYEDLEKSLTRWLLSDKRVINLSVENILRKAKQFARELEVDFQDVEWCKLFLDKFCERTNTKDKKDMDNLIVGVRQAVTSCIEPIGKVPLHAVGCMANIVISFREQVVYNVILCCMANGTKLPPMVITNIPYEEECYDEIRIIHKDDAVVFDDSSAIDWLNRTWCLRHNFTYQSCSLLVTNVPLIEDVKKLFVAAATEVVVVPSSIENVIHPLEEEIKDEFRDVFRKEYTNFVNSSEPGDIILSSQNLYSWISSAWQSICSKTIITKFQKLGIFYEPENPISRFPPEEADADHMIPESIQEIIVSNDEVEICGESAAATGSSSRQNLSTSVLQSTSSNNIDGDDIEIVFIKQKESEKNKLKMQEMKCFMCNKKFMSLTDLYVRHNCINLDNVLLESNDGDGITVKRRDCYYCGTTFDTDIDLLSHVCDYPF